MSDTSFEALMAEHHGEIYRYVRRVTGRVGEADDLSQETFLRAFRAYPRLPADANRRAWLFTIATNVCRNHFRSTSRRRAAYATIRQATDDVEAVGPHHVSVSREAGAVVETAVAGLPLKQRLAFLMRRVHDLDYAAIGESLGCSGDSARANVFQALRKIRRALDGAAAGEKEPTR